MKEKTNSRKGFFISILCCIIVIPVVLFLYSRMEGKVPEIDFSTPVRTIGLEGSVSGNISDVGCGIRDLWIAVSDGKTEKVLLEKHYDAAGFLSKGSVFNDSFTINVKPLEIGMTDGPAVLRIRITDYSWRNWFKGNITYIEKNILFDTVPPAIDVISTRHNISQGGAGLIIYRVSEKDTQNGVYVGDNYYPGYAGHFSDPSVYLCFFAWGHNQSPGTPTGIKAVDIAGNVAKSGFLHYVNTKHFKKDRINISDRFLASKLPSFSSLNGQNPGADNLDKFLFINRELRQKNSNTLKSAGSQTEKTLLWKNTFIRLGGSATRSTFADHRTYYYKGKAIDKQYHMGIDLASVKHADVPAANAGVIAMTKDIGIYGRSVVIDHGFGLFSAYSHLSRIDVQKGQKVNKGEVIGRTGITGLAGGDHLHYAMFINNTFVNPIEWWDGTWIKNNVTDKINEADMDL